MISRRKFTSGGMAASCLAWSGLRSQIKRRSAADRSSAAHIDDDVSQFVQPRIGTGGHGHCLPRRHRPLRDGATQSGHLPQRLGLVFRVQLLRRLHYGLQPHSSEWNRDRGHVGCFGYAMHRQRQAGSRHTRTPWTLATDRASRTKKNGRFRVTILYSCETIGSFAELTATSRVGVHPAHPFPKRSSHFIVDLAHGYDDGQGSGASGPTSK